MLQLEKIVNNPIDQLTCINKRECEEMWSNQIVRALWLHRSDLIQKFHKKYIQIMNGNRFQFIRHFQLFFSDAQTSKSLVIS